LFLSKNLKILLKFDFFNTGLFQKLLEKYLEITSELESDKNSLVFDLIFFNLHENLCMVVPLINKAAKFVGARYLYILLDIC
jgi:hypothetical protein